MPEPSLGHSALEAMHEAIGELMACVKSGWAGTATLSSACHNPL